MALIEIMNPEEMAELLCPIDEFNLQKWMLEQIEAGKAQYYRMAEGRAVEVVFRY